MWSRNVSSTSPRNCHGCGTAATFSRRNFPAARARTTIHCRCAVAIFIENARSSPGVKPMCGRAKLPQDVSEIKIDLKIDLDEIGHYQPRWNAAPTTKLPVVVADNARRILTLMRWGLVPSWAKD